MSDAARYRWLRKGDGLIGEPFIAVRDHLGFFSIWKGAPADAAIDRAMKADAEKPLVQELLEALELLAYTEYKGHALLDRMQFSDRGRLVFAAVTSAITRARGES